MAEKTTATFAFPYPTSAGEVKLGATNIEELAVAVDTTMASGNKVANGQVYSAQASLAEKTELEPSASRPTLVMVEIECAEADCKIYVGGVLIAKVLPALATSTFAFSFIVPAGKKWKWEKVSAKAVTVKHSELPL